MNSETIERIAVLIHYPGCWDTAAYPTLEDAMLEVAAWSKCECQKELSPENSD